MFVTHATEYNDRMRNYLVATLIISLTLSYEISSEKCTNILAYKPDSPHSSMLSNMNSSWTLRSILGKWHIMKTTTMQSNIAARFISDARCVFFLRVLSWLIWMPRKIFKLKYTSAVKMEYEAGWKYVYTKMEHLCLNIHLNHILMMLTCYWN